MILWIPPGRYGRPGAVKQFTFPAPLFPYPPKRQAQWEPLFAYAGHFNLQAKGGAVGGIQKGAILPKRKDLCLMLLYQLFLAQNSSIVTICPQWRYLLSTFWADTIILLGACSILECNPFVLFQCALCVRPGKGAVPFYRRLWTAARRRTNPFKNATQPFERTPPFHQPKARFALKIRNLPEKGVCFADPKANRGAVTRRLCRACNFIPCKKSTRLE